MPERAPLRDSASPARILRTEPLWVRVDRNRLKLAVFVALFVVGSSALLALTLAGVPVFLIGWGGGQIDAWSHDPVREAWIVAGAFGVMLALGALVSAVQLANAEDWVRSRLRGRAPEEGEAIAMRGALDDMSIAGGIGETVALVVVPSTAVNAFALGATRKRPLIGVTTGLLDAMSADEQRAVAAALVARIVSGDILFGTALAGLMGPLKSFRDWRMVGDDEVLSDLGGCAGDGCFHAGEEGCGCLFDADSDSAGGCLAVAGVVVFLAIVAALTYVAVRVAAWMVTAWGRLLHRTGHEKSDAEGMLLLKDPGPMVSALRTALSADNAVIVDDASYDGVFYTSTTGRPGIERAERRRLERLCQVLGVEGALAWGSLAETESPE